MDHSELSERDVKYAESLYGILHSLKKPELQNLVVEKLHSICKQRGFQSLKSKKALSYFKDKAFVTDFENGFVCYKISESPKTKKEALVDFLYFHVLKTGGGKIYVEEQEKDRVYFCWTAHFFDQYIKRMELEKETRKNSVRTFMKDFMMNDPVNDVKEHTLHGTISTFFKTGVCLGHYYIVKCVNSNEHLPKMIILFKTFVSNDMFHAGQKRALKNAEELAAESEHINNIIKNDCPKLNYKDFQV